MKGDTISLEKNIGYYFSKLLDKTTFIIKIIKCENCNIKFKQTNHNYIEYFHGYQLKPEMLKKENFVRNMLFYGKEQYICSYCKSNLTLEYDVRGCIAIDFENQNINIKLCEISHAFTLGKKKFILSGAIGFKITEARNKNYIAYSRSIQGFWFKHNNTKKKRSQYGLNSNVSIKLSMLIYVSNTM